MNTTVRETIRPSIESDERSRPKLKLLTAIIRPEKQGDVTEALNGLNIVGGFTVADARGSGRFATLTRCFRDVPFIIRLACEKKIEIIVPENRVDEVAESIRHHARTGNVGDGKIWVTDVATVIRIRTGERGLAAL